MLRAQRDAGEGRADDDGVGRVTPDRPERLFFVPHKANYTELMCRCSGFVAESIISSLITQQRPQTEFIVAAG